MKMNDFKVDSMPMQSHMTRYFDTDLPKRVWRCFSPVVVRVLPHTKRRLEMHTDLRPSACTLQPKVPTRVPRNARLSNVYLGGWRENYGIKQSIY